MACPPRFPQTAAAAILAALVTMAPADADPAVYPTPQDALDAMIAALQSRDRAALLVVFGPEATDLLYSGDAEEDAQNRQAVLGLYGEGYRFQPGADGEVVLILGTEDWPFPIPLARGGNGWQFDLAAGAEEVAAREIGRNELDTIALMDAYVDLQAEFRLTDHDGDGVMEFARAIVAADGGRDGLYWVRGGGPIGAQMARASLEGFSDGETDHPPEPHNGYLFRILDAQGPGAPGGEMSYLVNGSMVAGHALLAVPAVYGESGVHSFLVAENGAILQADLGEATLETAQAMTRYDPDEAWAEVGDLPPGD